MTKRPNRFLMMAAFVLLMAAPVSAGSLKKNAFEGVDNRGGVRDRCLNNHVAVTIKKLDHGLYFVRVKNRYSGEVRAGSYGEARNIACNKKTHLILYNSEE